MYFQGKLCFGLAVLTTCSFALIHQGEYMEHSTAPNKPRWIAVSYLYFRGSGVGVMAFSLVIKCRPNLFTQQSYKLWIFHINEKSPWSPLECIVLFLHFTIGEWGKIGQCVSFFKMAGTELGPVLAVIQVPTSLPIVGDILRVHISYVISSGEFVSLSLSSLADLT